jgi:hypothetical protein
MCQFTLNSQDFTNLISSTENVIRTRHARQGRFVHTSTEMTAAAITTVAPINHDHLIECKVILILQVYIYYLFL